MTNDEPLDVTDAPPSPPPPGPLSEGAANFGDLLADFVRDTGNAEWIARSTALQVLTVAGNVKVAQRQWEDQWLHYERVLVAECRRAGVSDARISKALGIERQNLHRRHGRRESA